MLCEKTLFLQVNKIIGLFYVNVGNVFQSTCDL